MRSLEHIAEQILLVRGRRIILDAHLARLYGVETRALLQAIRSNAERFPSDFVFRLTDQDLAVLRSQSVISKRAGRGGRSYVPFGFTEHGAIMAATVLKSRTAIEVAIYVVRAFVQLRQALAARREVSKRLDELERRLGTHDRAIGQ